MWTAWFENSLDDDVEGGEVENLREGGAPMACDQP